MTLPETMKKYGKAALPEADDYIEIINGKYISKSKLTNKELGEIKGIEMKCAMSEDWENYNIIPSVYDRIITLIKNWRSNKKLINKDYEIVEEIIGHIIEKEEKDIT